MLRVTKSLISDNWRGCCNQRTTPFSGNLAKSIKVDNGVRVMWRFLNSIGQCINVLLYILEKSESVSIEQYVASISHWIYRLKNGPHFDILGSVANNLLITSPNFLLIKTKVLIISYEQPPPYSEKPARQRRPSRTRSRFNKKKEGARRDWESKAKRVGRREERGCRMEARRRADGIGHGAYSGG